MYSQTPLRDALQRAVKTDFGEQHEAIYALCINKNGAPVGENHVSCLNELYAPSLASSVIQRLSIPYIYLAASFFCIDHVYDSDEYRHIEILAPSVLIAAATRRLSDVFGHEIEITERLLALHNKFLSAMMLEKECMSSELIHKDEEIHMVNRSYLFIFALEIIATLKSTDINEEDIADIRKFLFWMQCGDEIGDRREDFRARKNTLILKKAYRILGGRPTTEVGLEEFIYLSGFYEENCHEISNNMSKISSDVRKRTGARGDAFASFIERQVQLIDSVRNNFVRIKSGQPALPLSTFS